jgi:flavin reductase (DIM6/NTAB) family NADH-FMN oxidoreductase RutF
MNYSALEDNYDLPDNPWNALVIPRPIAWISTLYKGIHNLAPFSYFQTIGGCFEPPYYVSVTIGKGKDTLCNIEETQEFVVNFVTYKMRNKMNLSGRRFSHNNSEFIESEVEKKPSFVVKPWRVVNSPISLECKLYQIIPLPDDNNNIPFYSVIGRVIHIYIDDNFIKNGIVDTVKMNLIARLGYSDYTTVNSSWKMDKCL